MSRPRRVWVARRRLGWAVELELGTPARVESREAISRHLTYRAARRRADELVQRILAGQLAAQKPAARP